MPKWYPSRGSQVPHQQQFCNNNSDLQQTGHELLSFFFPWSLPDCETVNQWSVTGRKWWKRVWALGAGDQKQEEICNGDRQDLVLKRGGAQRSKSLHSCLFGYLRPASPVHVGADGVVRARSAHIQVCPVPRLNQTDEVSTFPLREGMTKPNRIKRLGVK